MNTWAVLGIVLSICFNILWILVLVATGWGKDIVKRWWRARTYKHGNHSNVIFIRNNNTADEIYTRMKDDESVEIKGKKYASNPKAQVIYKGIPTQFIIEGQAEPIDIYGKLDPKAMSTAELAKIITNNKTKSALDIISKYAPFILLGLAGLVILTIWVAYSNWQIFDVVVQKGTGTIIAR